MRGFRSLRSAETTLKGIETISTITKGQYENLAPGVAREMRFLVSLFSPAA